jgi:hypothetical protein
MDISFIAACKKVLTYISLYMVLNGRIFIAQNVESIEQGDSL